MTVSLETQCGLVDRLVILTSESVQAQWPQIQNAIRSAFVGARFNNGFNQESPVEHTWQGVFGADRAKFRHVIALAHDAEILGASFRVPTIPEAEDADIGWFFIAGGLALTAKLTVLDHLSDATDSIVREAGYSRIVTNMGTQAGARILRMRCGYVHAPTAVQENRWIKDLD